MTRPSPVVLVTAAVAAVLACGGGPNSLSGSLSEVFPLDVSSVHVLRNDDALVVSYEANRGRDIDLVLRFTLALDQLPLQTGKTIRISGYTDGGTLRASFLHNAAGEPARVLPPVAIGQFTLGQGGNPGEETSGSFDVSFVTDGSYGSGRGVSGSFRGVALDGGYGDWVP
jgi:hypothetical protein